ncbi:MAG: hypothetical protein MI799_09545, partial [Desulfobacterales bacterium]|nr:hypothetical protein [Desulfobacterales bacterium]
GLWEAISQNNRNNAAAASYVKDTVTAAKGANPAAQYKGVHAVAVSLSRLQNRYFPPKERISSVFLQF